VGSAEGASVGVAVGVGVVKQLVSLLGLVTKPSKHGHEYAFDSGCGEQ
jgi:hypothetical protein